MYRPYGIGKTATLKAIKALFGDETNLQRGKVSAEALLKSSSLTTFPIAVDDISSLAKMEDIAVSLFNAAAHTTVASGTQSPKGTIILSSNKSFVESDRYIYSAMLLIIIMTKIFSLYCRNASRLVHVPFFRPEREVTEDRVKRKESEEAMRTVCLHASSSIGHLIGIFIYAKNASNTIRLII